jgi:hypothetical protein
VSKQKFTTTIDSNLLEKIKIQAVKERCSVSDILEKLISAYLDSKNPTEP